MWWISGAVEQRLYPCRMDRRTDGPMDLRRRFFGAARTWRMFCDCLGHHQRDQHWSGGAVSSCRGETATFFLGINFGDQHKNQDLGDVRPR